MISRQESSHTAVALTRSEIVLFGNLCNMRGVAKTFTSFEIYRDRQMYARSCMQEHEATCTNCK